MTHLSVDELQITGALSIAVAGTIPGSGLVRRGLGFSAILVHGDEVQGTVETTAEFRDIDVERELVAEQLEHLILIGTIHEVQTRSDVGRLIFRKKEKC